MLQFVRLREREVRGREAGGWGIGVGGGGGTVGGRWGEVEELAARSSTKDFQKLK